MIKDLNKEISKKQDLTYVYFRNNSNTIIAWQKTIKTQNKGWQNTT